MGRDDFSLLADEEILNALDAGAVKLHSKLWPKVLEQAPYANSDEFFERCKQAIAEKHGLKEWLERMGAE